MPPTYSNAMQDDRFLLLRALGRGGMASVYRAFDRVEQRIVALKVLRRGETHGPGHPLAAEYEAWTRLRHPNIVEAFELAVARHGPIDPGTPYLVLEHVEGRPLDHGREMRRLAPAEIEQVGLQLLRGLEHVHAAGLVHRDVKPSNVLVASAGGCACYKLTDFGLAVERGSADEAGRVSGSLPYVAPESLLGRGLDSRADLYGLGIVLYQLATGRLPVAPARVEEILRWHLAGPPADPRRIVPRFPARLARFIRRLTAREPGERPRDPAEALILLGESPRRVPRSADVGPATRASLRLALDAVRRGEGRCFRLPDPGDGSPHLAAQLRAWAHVFGLAFHEIGGGPEGLEPCLVRVVQHLLIDRGGEARDCVERFALDRVLPLRRVGGVHLADGARLERPLVPEAAPRIADFLIESAARRGLVLLASPARLACALTRRVVATLARRLARYGRAAGCAGLLLVLDPAERSGPIAPRAPSPRAGSPWA